MKVQDQMVEENILKTEVIRQEKEELFQAQETEEIRNTEEVLQEVIHNQEIVLQEATQTQEVPKEEETEEDKY